MAGHASRLTSPSMSPRSLSPIAAADAARYAMREGTTSMNRTPVLLTLLALGMLLLLALL